MQTAIIWKRDRSLFFDGCCYCHQYHLMVRGTLSFMDSLLKHMGCSFSYWSSLVKMMHIWRNNAVELFSAWHNLFGAQSAIKCCLRVPPRPITGRWGAVRDCEGFIMRCPARELQRVFNAVFGKAAKAPGKEIVPAQTSGVDTLPASETAAYAEKMGRWTRDALQVVNDERSELAINIPQRIRQPLDHMFHSLQKRWVHGAEPANLARFIWVYEETINREIRALLRPEAWADLVEAAPQEHRGRSRIGILKAVLRMHADYERRVSNPLRAGPYNLLWFGKELPNDFCPKRQHLALCLLDTPDVALHMTASKLKQLFRAELANVAQTGKCPICLYWAMRLVALYWRADVQEIEGINSLIELACRRAPRISLPLVDARVGLRKDLGLGTRDKRHVKYSQMMDSGASDLLDDAIQQIDHASAIMSQEGRFEAPKTWAPPPTTMGDAHPSIHPPLFSPEIGGWAGSYSMVWYHRAREAGKGSREGSCLLFADAPETVWVCVLTHGYTGHFAKFDLLAVEGDAGPTRRLQLSEPVVFKSSLQVFADYYEQCHGLGAQRILVTMWHDLPETPSLQPRDYDAIQTGQLPAFP